MFNADKLRGVMAEKRFSAERMARVLGINPATMYRKMAGTSEFTRSEIQLISSSLELSASDIQAIFFA